MQKGSGIRPELCMPKMYDFKAPSTYRGLHLLAISNVLEALTSSTQHNSGGGGGGGGGFTSKKVNQAYHSYVL